MMDRCKEIFNIKRIGYRLIIGAFLLCMPFVARSQVTVYTVQNLNFGTFYQGNTGGTVEISLTGSRSATGDVILLNSGLAVSQAIFDIEAPANTTFSIMSGPDVILTGSNGGSVTLHTEATDPGSPFTTSAIPPARTRVQVASTLTIGDRIASPAGNYTGTFSITFYQE